MSFGGDVSLRSRGGGGGGGGGGGVSSYTVASMPNYAVTPQQDLSGGGQPQQQQPMQQQPMQIAYQPNGNGAGHSGMQQQQMQQQQPPYMQTAPPMAVQQTQQQQPGIRGGGYSSGGSGAGISLQGAFPQAPMPSQSTAAMPVQQFYQPMPQAQAAFPQPQMHANDAVYNLDDGAEGGQGGMSYGVRRTGVGSRSSSPATGFSNGGGGTSYGGGLSQSSSSDDRLRRQQNADALNHYVLFMYALMALSVLTMLVAWLAMGSAAKYVVFVLTICIGSFIFTLQLTRWAFSKDDSNPAMRVISEAIKEGSEGFLRVQYSAIAVIAAIIAALIGIIYLFRESPQGLGPKTLAVVTAVSYLIGAFCSALAGYIGVWVSIRVNIRVAVAASRLSYKDALLLAFRGGAISAALSASLCILGVTVLYVFCYLFFVTWGSLPARHVPMLLVGYGFGGALVALFMQLGGGIMTKAADVGADMCGKVEANIPEDDPRNPAVIADLVGDNVGDCAGSMADVFESIAAEVIGTMILGAALAHEARLPNPESFIFFPLVIHALDLIISSVGVMLTTPTSDKEDPLTTMKRAYAICMGLAAVGIAVTCRLLLYTDVAPNAWWNYTLCGWIGIAMSFGLITSTQYYTDPSFSPVKRIAAASQTGHGTNVIAGLAVGLESTCPPVLIICFALMAAFTLGQNSGLPGMAAGVFGTAVATMGMLCTAVFVLTQNNSGPIADNAGGIVEMSGQPHEVRVITDRLDSMGNVTKAASKGYAVGGSALSCFVLFQAFLDETSAYSGLNFSVVNIAKVEVVCGGLIGSMMIFLFAGWAMQSVGTTAQKVVWEVRRQFKNKPGIMDGTDKPDYDACVAIVTREALKEMVWPALLALLLPVAVGFGFKWFGAATGRPQLGVEVVGGFMMFGTLTGLLMASFMDNAGGAWDNAKKLIESQGQKGSDAHKAAVTGDTVGDPFKDTAGPALHVIITTMSTTILVMAPMFVGAGRA